MKKTALMFFLALGALLTGCKESISFGGDEEDKTKTGKLVISGLNVAVAKYDEEMSSSGNTNDPQASADPGRPSPAKATRAEGSETAAAPADYIVRIRNQKTGEEVDKYTCGELGQLAEGKIELYPGVYVISAESPDYEAYAGNAAARADWETPVYYGSVSKTVMPKEETAVSDLVCTLANIKTTVALSQDLCGLFMSDAEAESLGKQKLAVTLSVGGGSLTFDRAKSESGAAGYFKAAAGTNTIKVELTGMYNSSAGDEAPEYDLVNWEQEIAGCTAGQWRKLSIGILNAHEGNVRFELIVQNWVYDEKINVDVMGLYSAFFGEETIKEGEVSDADAPVVSLAGGAIENGYTISPSIYDADLEKWTANLKVLITPVGGAGVASVDVSVDSDNAALLAAAGGEENRIAIWPSNTVSAYLTVREDASVVSATLKDAGMSEIFRYPGVHTVKYIATDSHGRTSYTTLAITVTESGGGPEIVWTNADGSFTYDLSQRYNHDEVEILITVTTESAFTDFSVDIISPDILSPAALAGVGLSSHLDLINPGGMEGALNGLGFPTGGDVTSSKVVRFDITGFMGLLSALQTAGDCDFRLSVTDASGTTVRTVQLDVVIP